MKHPKYLKRHETVQERCARAMKAAIKFGEAYGAPVYRVPEPSPTATKAILVCSKCLEDVTG